MPESFPDAALMQPGTVSVNEHTPANGFFRDHLRLASGVLAASIALAGCTSTVVKYIPGHNRKPAVYTSAYKVESGPCVDIAQPGENLADVDVAPNPDAYLPALYTTDTKGNQTPLSAEDASNLVRKQGCGDVRVLALLSAVQELWQNQQLPSQSLVTDIENQYNLFMTDPGAIAGAEEAVYPWLSNLIPTTTFAITAGQATAFTANRVNGKLSSFDAQTLGSTESLTGYKIGFIADNEQLTASQRNVYAKLQELVVITDQGYLVVNDLIADTTIGLVNPNAAVTQTANPNVSVSTQNPNAGSTAKYSGVSTHGHKPESLPGATTEATTGTDHTPNTGTTVPGPGPGSTVPGTTPTTVGSTPPTTIGKTPPTTIETPPPTSTTTTSTLPPKDGGGTCDPNYETC